ncbi:MAG: hypothetical protein OMM_00125 [Candidatus Magnetoglobus multicellularis str. Araruama]|uniref:Prepilin-type N-terminal cleavage/methylation domain-containing protein n=1 Tax=Candidatus Magnetoglobus multicellularis str. Araruama TaxID=890399 RepID=A0A1V1PIC8_9BACT|nr:MAG: hypothetical protein OMM_00125 [Candidatus Magnetoglobus multicellularis str. Araruama]
MQSKSGYTLFEIVITLLVISLVCGYYMIPVLTSIDFLQFDPRYQSNDSSKYKSFLSPAENLQEMLNLKMVMENITHDYIHRCFSGTDFDLIKLRQRIGRTNDTIDQVEDDYNEYHPYGFTGQTYVPYFVKYNEFVKERKDANGNVIMPIELTKDIPSKGQMILVTIQPQEKSTKSLTVLFTEKKKL